MKTILFDYSNEGVLYVGENLPALNHLKFGMVDADLRVLGTASPGYNKISKAQLKDQTQHFQITKSNDIKEMSPESITDLYLERRRLARLRSPLIERACYSAWANSTRGRISPWDGFENNLENMLKECNPETQTWSDSLNEYAFINNLKPEHAYREVKLQFENIHSLKIRIYATLVYIVGKINAITSEDQVASVSEEITNRFWKDVWI